MVYSGEMDLAERARLLRERARSGERQQIYVEQHRRVIAAIAQREAHAAEQTMREHLELVRDGLLKVMTSPLPDRIDENVPPEPVTTSNKDRIRHGT